MKLGLLIFGILIAISAEIPATAQVSVGLETAGREFVKQLVDSEFEKASQGFDSTLSKAMPVLKLKETWHAVIKAVGPFEEVHRVRIDRSPEFETVFVTCMFARGNIDVRVVFDSKDRIAGLSFRPAKASSNYKPPSYAKPSLFYEVEVKIGSNPWQLPGTLSIPHGDGPFSAVILVHGSGPNDRDASVGQRKPFKDVAWGLSSRRIVVLRYDKRTFAHPEQTVRQHATMTVKDEVIDDVFFAVDLLKGQASVDPRRVFVLGHSWGGYLIPRIGQRDRNRSIAGYIVMAGNTRPLEDLLVDQLSYLYNLDGTVTAQDAQSLEELKERAQRVKSPELTLDALSSELPLNVAAAYWLDLRHYHPGGVAARLNKPMLILQGERDYKVTVKDFEGWRDAMSSRKDVRMILYPQLNHSMVAGTGKSTPAEDKKPGNVDARVINDIVNWITPK